jgi:hypothetical protein
MSGKERWVSRNNRGNMLVFITASVVGILALVGFFSLGLIRL